MKGSSGTPHDVPKRNQTWPDVMMQLGLENRLAGIPRYEGSNPSLSAI